jgi:tetratricopeptide (TPR) repeat protein
MTGSRAIASFCLSCFLLPVVCAGQSRSIKVDQSSAGTFRSPTVSLRELSIPDRARKAFSKGTQLFAAREWIASIAEFQKAIKAFGDLYEAYYKIGIAQLELQRGLEAEASFRKSIEISSGQYAPPLFGLGLALSNAGRYADAEAAVRAGLDLEPGDSAGHFAMAWVWYTAGRIGDAEDSARKAIRYNPNFAMAHLLLAQIHRQQNNQAALVAELDSFLALDPHSPRSVGARAARAEAQAKIQTILKMESASANP